MCGILCVMTECDSIFQSLGPRNISTLLEHDGPQADWAQIILRASLPFNPVTGDSCYLKVLNTLTVKSV